jgi:hypothetical protein
MSWLMGQSALVNGLLEKTSFLVNGISTLINGQLKKSIIW